MIMGARVSPKIRVFLPSQIVDFAVPATGIVNPARRLQVVDNAEHPTSFTAFDRQRLRRERFHRLVISRHIELSFEHFK